MVESEVRMVESKAVPLGWSGFVHHLSILSFEILSNPLELLADWLVPFFSLEDGGWFDTCLNWALREVTEDFEGIGFGSTVGVQIIFTALWLRVADGDISARLSREEFASVRFGFAVNLDVKNIEQIEHCKGSLRVGVVGNRSVVFQLDESHSIGAALLVEVRADEWNHLGEVVAAEGVRRWSWGSWWTSGSAWSSNTGLTWSASFSGVSSGSISTRSTDFSAWSFRSVSAWWSLKSNWSNGSLWSTQALFSWWSLFTFLSIWTLKTSPSFSSNPSWCTGFSGHSSGSCTSCWTSRSATTWGSSGSSESHATCQSSWSLWSCWSWISGHTVIARVSCASRKSSISFVSWSTILAWGSHGSCHSIVSVLSVVSWGSDRSLTSNSPE